MALIDKLTAIADAIRAKTGKSDKLTLDQMATEIESIESGGGSASEPYIEYKYTSTNRVLSAVMRGYTFIPYCCFYGQNNITSLEIPNIIKVIENSAFHNCSNLALTELPSGLTSIGSYTFYNCSKLALTELPSGLTSIGSYAFRYCTGLTSLTFKGTPTTINSLAFNGCTNLTDIYVPWSEGAVANAPWGATNATIHYDAAVDE